MRIPFSCYTVYKCIPFSCYIAYKCIPFSCYTAYKCIFFLCYVAYKRIPFSCYVAYKLLPFSCYITYERIQVRMPYLADVTSTWWWFTSPPAIRWRDTTICYSVWHEHMIAIIKAQRDFKDTRFLALVVSSQTCQNTRLSLSHSLLLCSSCSGFTQGQVYLEGSVL